MPKELTALMSAVREEKKGDEEKGETRTYKFEQKVSTAINYYYY